MNRGPRFGTGPKIVRRKAWVAPRRIAPALRIPTAIVLAAVLFDLAYSAIEWWDRRHDVYLEKKP